MHVVNIDFVPGKVVVVLLEDIAQYIVEPASSWFILHVYILV